MSHYQLTAKQLAEVRKYKDKKQYYLAYRVIDKATEKTDYKGNWWFKFAKFINLNQGAVAQSIHGYMNFYTTKKEDSYQQASNFIAENILTAIIKNKGVLPDQQQLVQMDQETSAAFLRIKKPQEWSGSLLQTIYQFDVPDPTDFSGWGNMTGAIFGGLGGGVKGLFEDKDSPGYWTRFGKVGSGFVKGLGHGLDEIIKKTEQGLSENIMDFGADLGLIDSDKKTPVTHQSKMQPEGIWATVWDGLSESFSVIMKAGIDPALVEADKLFDQNYPLSPSNSETKAQLIQQGADYPNLGSDKIETQLNYDKLPQAINSKNSAFNQSNLVTDLSRYLPSQKQNQASQSLPKIQSIEAISSKLNQKLNPKASPKQPALELPIKVKIPNFKLGRANAESLKLNQKWNPKASPKQPALGLPIKAKIPNFNLGGANAEDNTPLTKQKKAQGSELNGLTSSISKAPKLAPLPQLNEPKNLFKPEKMPKNVMDSSKLSDPKTGAKPAVQPQGLNESTFGPLSRGQKLPAAKDRENTAVTTLVNIDFRSLIDTKDTDLPTNANLPNLSQNDQSAELFDPVII